jgi:uncharacterized peroxidase-related enzyme
MSWIAETPRAEASKDLADVYDRVASARGRVANILKVHSVSPHTMLAHLGLYTEVMFGPSELTRAEREMIAVAVSVTNRCHY